jgi:hypothetical protein
LGTRQVRRTILPLWLFVHKTTVVIPPCPFQHPTMEKYRDRVADNYRKAIRAALDGA